MNKKLLAFPILLGLVACASQGPTRIEAEQVYLKHAGPDVSQIAYNGFLRGWRPVGQEAVLIELSRDSHLLIGLSPACHSVVRDAERLTLNTTSRLLVTRLDRVQLDRASCRITSIREVDYAAARQELDALRQLPDDEKREITIDQEPGSTA